MQKNDDRYMNTSMLQANEILKAVADCKEPMTVGQIVERTGLSLNIVFRSCLTMERVGWLQKVGDRYRIGMFIGIVWARVRADREETIRQARRDMELLDGGTPDER